MNYLINLTSNTLRPYYQHSTAHTPTAAGKRCHMAWLMLSPWLGGCRYVMEVVGIAWLGDFRHGMEVFGIAWLVGCHHGSEIVGIAWRLLASHGV